MGGQQSSQTEPGNPNNPEVTWWCKMLARAIGTVGASIAIFLGIMTCVMNVLHPLAIVAGVILILFAFLVIIMESPCCCVWFDLTKPIATFAESRSYWHKAAFYCVIAIFPIVLYATITSIFGSGMIFATGVFYGLMALGRKADKDSMMQRAGGDDAKANLVDNEDLP